MTKAIAKRSAAPTPKKTATPITKKSPKKAAVKRAPSKKTTKKPVANSAQVGSTLEINAILGRMNSKVKLTDDAVQLLNAFITSLVTTIAKKAETIVKKAQKQELTCKDVKEAVRKVF